MKENNVLIPEIYASYPYDGKILEYYKGVFEAVYIILHPFYRGVTLNLNTESFEHWPNDEALRKGCEIITWKQVIELTDFENISQIDIGLRTLTRDLDLNHQNQIYASMFKKLRCEAGITYPDETRIISPFLSHAMLSCVQKLGYSKLWLGEECSYLPPILHDLDELLLTQQTYHCNYTEDHQLLFATHWDSHYTFLCSSKKLIDQILIIHPFEGFFCTPNTEVYWGLHEI
ncbi:DUF2711 family protein [Acinetobacter sp.]|uniref:DUF2711 family protein n=1 Tax=Acinetobacter sp. TaxID=472 RepID=UPI0026477F64|nr:DUF2711 family protein [Acinetobacter sp.]MDN5513291.1 DUF2711 domain-containing protein [Acinetobacter sp.]MDN5525751.1 DUF2711 domain-containing protein [Acinetobacter sp.]